MTEHDRRQDQILTLLLDWYEQGRSPVMSGAIEQQLSLSPQQLAVALEILQEKRCVRLSRLYGGDTPVSVVYLEAEGMQRAQQGGAGVNDAHDQRRDAILKLLLDLGRPGTHHVPAAEIARRRNRPLEEIEYDLSVLRRELCVEGPRPLDRSGSTLVTLTSIGEQRAREGRRPDTAAGGQTQNVTILGDHINLQAAQSGSGPIFQTIQQPAATDEIRQLLSELREELASWAAPKGVREEGLVHVQQLREELERPEGPRPSMIKVIWDRLDKFATLEGARQGGAFLLDAVPKLGALIGLMLGG